MHRARRNDRNDCNGDNEPIEVATSNDGVQGTGANASTGRCTGNYDSRTRQLKVDIRGRLMRWRLIPALNRFYESVVVATSAL